MSSSLEIAVVAHRPEDRHLVPDIKRGRTDPPHPHFKGVVGEVYEAESLAKAAAHLRERPDRRVFVALGFRESEIFRILDPSEIKKRRMAVVIRVPSTSRRKPRQPSSSFRDTGPFVTARDPRMAIRKAVVRLLAHDGVAIRELRSEADFEAYFTLRYRVYKEMGYIPPHRDYPDSDQHSRRWDVSHTDRTARPVGAFTSRGELIGCARLVNVMGREIPRYASLIEKLVRRKNDEVALQNFSYPNRLEDPYDILSSFREFRAYFGRLVRSNISNAEVSRVIVEHDYRNKGLGEALVDTLISIARSGGVKVLFLGCLDGHQPFYENCGFSRLDLSACDSFTDVGVPAIAMERWLNGATLEGEEMS